MSRWHYGMDFGYADDAAVFQVWKKPGKFRKFMRKIKLDKSK